MLDLAKNLNFINDSDKSILCEAIEEHQAGKGFSHAYSMSIFSKAGSTIIAGAYKYRDLRDTGLLYLNRCMSRGGPLLLDEQGLIVPNSNVMLGYPHLLISHLQNFLEAAQCALQIQPIKAFEGNALAIQTWFITYGHYHDEVYALADFLRETEFNLRPVVDYPPSDNMLLNYKTSINYERIQSLILGPKGCNLFEAGMNPVSLDGGIVIDHLIDSPTFHLFSTDIRASVVSKSQVFQPSIPPYCFLSREQATHLPRNIANQKEVEDACKRLEIPVVYPEYLSFDRLVRQLNATKGIIITWGGSLTNLVYLKHGAKVVVLKSSSYRHENISLFDKIIMQRGLKIVVIDTSEDGNEVDVPALMKTIIEFTACP